MKNLLTFVVIFLLCRPCFDLDGQKLIPGKGITSVCYAGKNVRKIYIPPRLRHTPRKGLNGSGKITVNYSGFTVQAKNAVEFAVGILEDMLPSDLNMTLDASWVKIETAGVLGNSGVTGYVAGWNVDALMPMVYYPITVAEKIGGKKINEDYEADMELQINSSIPWYTGTDGNTPTNKYDLVTVVLHEVCHGLGFYDSFNADNSKGWYASSGLPMIYDMFVENGSGKKLTDTTLFPQYSYALYAELTGGQIFFNGPLTLKYMAGDRPRLFAPSTWDEGSSISHLDETRTLEKNALMTPYIDFGEAIHDPGNLTLSMLGDIGWVNTRIIPAVIKDTEEHLTSVEISAAIKSDTTYNKGKVGLVYSYDDFNTSHTLLLNETATSGQFSATVAVTSYNTRLSYYFFAEDSFLRLYKSPSRGETAPYKLYIGTDTVKPVISHTPADYYFEKVDSIPFEANVTDNLGIDTVYVEYNINNGPAQKAGMLYKGNDRFRISLNVKTLNLMGGDSINYRIVAVDRASGHNTRSMPSSGYLAVGIESILPEVESYSTDFSDASADFFNSGFTIAQPAGFNSPALHSEHPYRSPEDNLKTLNFSSVLRRPVIYDAAGMTVSFRQLVLVEPGEEGSQFGFSNFYDYVIVEGSGDFGKSWFPLAPGYDSRINSFWESAYNSSMDGINSSFTGNESMMIPYTFYPKVTDKISDGDPMLIRFRLFSDPFAHGWGWVIDDLKVAPLIDNIEDTGAGETRIYPNPGNGIFTIGNLVPGNAAVSIVSIFNATGQCMVKDISIAENEIKIDISGLPAGLYLIVIRNADSVRTLKYSLIK